ncbi:MAG TPA: PqiC family protein [Nitrospiraceae bacterium]|nr:PqiC family protein [Nitrospiraceae bacterium]
MTRGRIRIAILSVTMIVLSGCSSSPRSSFYTLSTGAPPESTTSSQATAAYRIAVGPVTVPQLVDRPQFVVRAGANQVTLAELHRWAEPLQSEIPRVIALNLTQLLGAKQVSAHSHGAIGHAEYRVIVDIQRFDSALGEAVTIDALWTIRRASGERSTGRSLVMEPAGAEGYDALVAAHSRALARVSRDIAEAIRADGIERLQQEK